MARETPARNAPALTRVGDAQECSHVQLCVVGANYIPALGADAWRSARRQGLERTFLLTTRTAAWFIEQGYTAGSLEDLPDERRSKWVPERNSRVMIKDLSTALY